MGALNKMLIGIKESIGEMIEGFKDYDENTPDNATAAELKRLSSLSDEAIRESEKRLNTSKRGGSSLKAELKAEIKENETKERSKGTSERQEEREM